MPVPARFVPPDWMSEQEMLIECFARGMTDLEIAHAIGVDIKDVYKASHDWVIRRKVDQKKTILMERTFGSVISMLEDSMKVFLDAMHDPDPKHGRTRLNAAKAMHELALRWRESLSVEPRLEDIAARILDGKITAADAAATATMIREKENRKAIANGEKPKPVPVKLVYATHAPAE